MQPVVTAGTDLSWSWPGLSLYPLNLAVVDHLRAVARSVALFAVNEGGEGEGRVRWGE